MVCCFCVCVLLTMHIRKHFCTSSRILEVSANNTVNLRAQLEQGQQVQCKPTAFHFAQTNIERPLPLKASLKRPHTVALSGMVSEVFTQVETHQPHHVQ